MHVALVSAYSSSQNYTERNACRHERFYSAIPITPKLRTHACTYICSYIFMYVRIHELSM
jgi:hypothetical protein